MADIIAESGLSAGSIYSHYDSKVELIRAVASDVLSGRAEAIAAGALDLYTPGQALMAFVEAVTVPMFASHIDASGVFTGDAKLDASAATVLTELARWEQALRVLRTPQA